MSATLIDSIYAPIQEDLRLVEENLRAISKVDTFPFLSGLLDHVLDFGGQALNLEGATGFAMVAMQAVFAEVEAKRISERTKEALKYRRDRGMPVNAHS
ncbi:MAG: recombinase family protein, partial [Chloroflexi bacterium]|nr:recombinase family protein [Chloroflexota bacterium]